MARSCDYRALAMAQDVSRPFEILVRMPAKVRRRIADELGCRLPSTGSAEFEAWKIINRDMRGLQARTHNISEQLSPFSRNNNWWEILTRSARRCGLKVYAGLSDREVERLLFERLAILFVEHNLGADSELVDRLAEANPDFYRALQFLQLSPIEIRAVLTAIALAEVPSDRGLPEGLLTAREWLTGKIGWTWRVSIADGLSLLQQKLAEICGTWADRGFAEPAVGNTAKVGMALAAIYFQDLVDRTLQEVEMLGA